MVPSAPKNIAVVGLGYVGLPLAVALAKCFPVVGFDVDASRVAELSRGHDRTREVTEERLTAARCRFTSRPEDMAGCDVFILTVPTPVDRDNRPDLGAVRAACATVGKVIGKGAIVVLESTVAPGVTEEVCGPAVASVSGLICGRDFFLGYSPERINPGDREHTVERITKVVAGQTPETAQALKDVYGAITTGGVFIARDIRTAEAAKVIENAQRDINIAFINEVSMIFARAGISIHDVLDASATKWNFLRFTPGLVGGHCIGVDPFYLAEFAQRVGHHPEIILAGRRINDGMGDHFAGSISAAAGNGASILVLGLTFKENVPDLRNSKVVDLVEGLRRRGHTVDVHDPHADPAAAKDEYGIALLPTLDNAGPYGAIVGAVPHDEYRVFDLVRFGRLLASGGLVADIKGMWRMAALPPAARRWQL
ncbi:MAG: nucleotide sugar dehydrogenase [Alphaproteobacteria bacterium]|nr:nucleotide sugar dehydrogenase [Alphaproteobacteria bacterium]